MAMTLPPIGGANKGLPSRPKKKAPVIIQTNTTAVTQVVGPSNVQILEPLRREQTESPRTRSRTKNGQQPRKSKSQPVQQPEKQPSLSKQETSVYRNTYKHNLCLDMLEAGYHKSFTELFALIRQQEDERIQAGPESVLWGQTQLDDQHEKLDVLKMQLTKAEEAERHAIFQDVYMARYDLAHYFKQTGDKWLADHFFSTCLHVSSDVQGDAGRTRAEGHCNIGKALEERGDFKEACTHFESYHKLARDHKEEWLIDDTETSLYNDACIHLYRIYTTIGDQIEAAEPEQSVSLFQKAYNMAEDSSDAKLTGEAAYRLGLSYAKKHEPETALVHLHVFLDSCTAAEDDEGIGRACDAIAAAHKQLGNIEECIKYLDMFVTVAEKTGQDKAYSRACHNLGAMHNIMGRYDEAHEYFSKAYNISRSTNDTETMSVNRVQYGIAMAHKMLQGMGKHIILGTRPCIERLCDWKSARADDLGKELPMEVDEPASKPSSGKSAESVIQTEQSED